jgi:hypothetical protein
VRRTCIRSGVRQNVVVERIWRILMIEFQSGTPAANHRVVGIIPTPATLRGTVRKFIGFAGAAS